MPGLLLLTVWRMKCGDLATNDVVHTFAVRLTIGTACIQVKSDNIYQLK